MSRLRFGGAAETLLFLALGLIWGSAYLAVEVVGTAVGPLTLVALRLGIGAAALGMAVRVRSEPTPPTSAWPHIVVVAVTGLVVPFSLITWSQRDIDAGLASVFNAATPLFTVVLAGLLLGDEGLSGRRLLGVLVGFGGVVIVVGGGIHGGGEPLALLAMVGAVLSLAVTAVWTRGFLRGLRPLALASGQVRTGFLIVAVLAAALERPTLIGVPVAAWLAVAWLGVVVSGVAPLLFFRLVLRWGAGRTAVVNYLIPIVGVVLGAAFLAEELQPSVVLGGLVIAVGMRLATGPTITRRRDGPRVSPAGRPANPVLDPVSAAA